MMMAECLTDVWLNLFQVCWEFSIVPLVCMEGEDSVSSTEEASERGV